MGRKSKFPLEVKLENVLKCIERKDSVNHTAKLLGISITSLSVWVRNYQSLGIYGLTPTSKNASYSSEFKEKVVIEYLEGKGSLSDISKTHGIKSKDQLRTWIMKYNSHEKLKSSGTGGTAIMTKGRKTSFDERVKIVEYYIKYNNNYSETAEKFNVSYQQVYTWTKKYLEHGIKGLVDNRGRKLTKDELTETEKLKAENKLLEAKLRNKQMEIDFLKKLEEIKRRRS